MHILKGQRFSFFYNKISFGMPVDKLRNLAKARDELGTRLKWFFGLLIRAIMRSSAGDGV